MRRQYARSSSGQMFRARPDYLLPKVKSMTSPHGMLAHEWHFCDEPQLPNTANHTSKGILLTEDYSWRERKKGLKQERSDKNKKTERTEGQLFYRDCLIINLRSRDTSRNVSDIPRQVTLGLNMCISATYETNWKGHWGLCPARTFSEAASAAALPEKPFDN